MTIKIRVTSQRFEEVVSVDDEMYLNELTRKEIYDYMVQFVIGEDGNYLEATDARRLFKQIPARELTGHITAFFKAISEAFVPPPSGEDSGGPSSPE